MKTVFCVASIFSREKGGSIFLLNGGVYTRSPHGATTQTTNVLIVTKFYNGILITSVN